MEAVGLCEIST